MSHPERKRQINFKLFGGGISYCSGEDREWKGINESSGSGVGRKLAAFLEYLILNHGKIIASEDLMNTFWPEDSSADPANALKYTVHKTRHLLKQMFPEEENLLVTHRGHYSWNPDVKITLDAEEFEKACILAKHPEDGITFEEMLDAIDLYTGDILTNSDAEWILPLRIYYRTLYVDACKSALKVLDEDDRWVEIIRICERAYTMEPMEEEFTRYMMRALIAMGQPGRAVEHYEAYRVALWSELNLVPSEEVEQIQAAAVEAMNTDEQDIVRMLLEEDSNRTAFLCSFNVFRSMVLLETRHMSRNKTESSILIVKAGGRDSNSAPTTDVRRIERVLLKTLRCGDPIARLNAGSYIVLLSGASLDNARVVTERIERVFRASYPRSKAYLDYKAYPLTVSSGGNAPKE